MRQTTPLGQRVDQFFESLPDKGAPAVLTYVDRLYSSYCEAEKATQHQLLLNLITWASFYSIAEGIVGEATIGALKISNLSYLSLLGPVIIGFLSYTLATALFFSIKLGFAFWRCMKHVLPEACAGDLEMLLGPPTFVRAERISRAKEHTVHAFARGFMIALLLSLCILGTLAALIHISWLTWSITAISWYAAAISITLGGVFWVRALLVWVRIGRY